MRLTQTGCRLRSPPRMRFVARCWAVKCGSPFMLRRSFRNAPRRQTQELPERRITRNALSTAVIGLDHGLAGSHLRKDISRWCRGWESNPHAAFAARDFKSRASANFATPACPVIFVAFLLRSFSSGRHDACTDGALIRRHSQPHGPDLVRRDPAFHIGAVADTACDGQRRLSEPDTVADGLGPPFVTGWGRSRPPRAPASMCRCASSRSLVICTGCRASRPVPPTIAQLVAFLQSAVCPHAPARRPDLPAISIALTCTTARIGPAAGRACRRQPAQKAQSQLPRAPQEPRAREVSSRKQEPQLEVEIEPRPDPVAPGMLAAHEQRPPAAAT